MSTQRTVEAVIPGAADVVRAFYVDLDNLRVVHPLVVSVQRIARTVGRDGHVVRYRVRDRIPFGVMALPVTYAATLHVPSEGDVWTEARQLPRVRLRGRVSFDAVDGGTRLTERLDFTAPRPLIGVTVRRAVAAHAEMLTRIRRHFEGAGGPR